MKGPVGLLMLSPLDLGFSVIKESQQDYEARVRATQRSQKFGPEVRPSTEFPGQQSSPQMGGTTEDEEGRQINLGGLTPEQQRVQGMGEGYQGPNLLLMGPPEASGNHEGQIDEQFNNFVEQNGMPSSIHHHSMGDARHVKGWKEGKFMFNDGMKAHARRLSVQHGIPLVESGPRLHMPGDEDSKVIGQRMRAMRQQNPQYADDLARMLDRPGKGGKMKAIKALLGDDYGDYRRRMTAGRLSMAMGGHDETGETTHSLVFGHAGSGMGGMHRAIAEKEHQSGYVDGGDLLASPAGGEEMYTHKMSPHDVDYERKKEWAESKRGRGSGGGRQKEVWDEPIVDAATAQRMQDAKDAKMRMRQGAREETEEEKEMRAAGATGATRRLGGARRPLQTSRKRGSQTQWERESLEERGGREHLERKKDLKSENPMDRAWNALQGQALF